MEVVDHLDQTKTSVFLVVHKNLYSNRSAVLFHIVEDELLKTFISVCDMSQPQDHK